jgi:transcriptional regulator with XRE-family HTH domain
VSERSDLISKLQSDFKTRAAYIQAKVGTLVPSQIRALRLKSEMPRQPDLARAAEMHQSRISMLETAGANPTITTLSAIAAALKVGLKVEFVSFSEMLDWENGFSQDQFKVTGIDNDLRFLAPDRVSVPASAMIIGRVTPFVTQYGRFYEGHADLAQDNSLFGFEEYEPTGQNAMIFPQTFPQIRSGSFVDWKPLPAEEHFQTITQENANA